MLLIIVIPVRIPLLMKGVGPLPYVKSLVAGMCESTAVVGLQPNALLRSAEVLSRTWT